MLSLALAAPLPLPAQEPIPNADPALEAALLTATNAARARFGKPALSFDEGLARAAREHAGEMASLNYFSHGSPVSAHDTLPKRLALAGSPLVDVAENLVMLGESSGDTHDAQTAVQDWLNSPHHRANLLNGRYDRVGFGTARNAQGQLFIVQDFGAQHMQLLAATVTEAQRAVSELSVTLRLDAAASVLLDVSGSPEQTRSLPAGTTTVSLSSEATGTLTLVVGVATGGNHYLIDDGGSVDVATGSYRPDPGQPRSHLQITAVRVRRTDGSGVRLSLAYAAPASAGLALFLQGNYQPAARVSPDHFQLFLPASLGVATVSVGIDQGGGNVDIVHRFHIDAAATLPKLLAGPGSTP
jgi:uncharacterized protein YkwD